MRLYIHDDEDRHGRHDEGGFGLSAKVLQALTVKLAIKDLTGLHGALADLVKQGKTFRRVLWMTHGSPGGLFFGKDQLDATTLKGFAGKGYEKLFPQPTKMYFSGCNVAGDQPCDGGCKSSARDAGWTFLESVGQTFLLGGGYSMGWTSTGYGWNQAIFRSLISSHSLHFSGDVRIVTFGAKGKVLERLSYDGGMFSGNLFDQVKILAKLDAIVPQSL